MIIDEVYLQYVHMIIFIVVKMGKNNNINLYYIRIMGVLLQASAMSVNKGSASIKTWNASGNPGGLQTHAFCHN